jgi:aspartyl-tRNA(Asn)/glutamyl-tRNA(Gln) amidotransferase subunit A
MKTQEKLKQYLEKIKKEDKKINAFLELRDDKELLKEAKELDAKKNKGKLAGKIIGIKANICVKGLHASCASKTLEDYKAAYDAEVVKRIKEEDGLIIGMLNCDEFASGSSGETSAFGPTQNPAAPGRIPGGSCSGSAAAIAAGFCDITLGSDTGGSIRSPACHCGVVGVKPSHTAVSRYGLIDLAMSTDTIGALAKTVEDVALMLEVISGKDDKDAICQSKKIKGMEKVKDIVVGVLDLSGLKVDKKIKDLIESKTKEFVEKNNWKTKLVKIENLDLAVETYYPIVYVEAFSGTRKLDGRRFGKKVEDSCGPEFLRRILGGAEISKAEHAGRYYHLALKAKNLIVKEFENAFKQVDCIVSPVVPILPWKIGEKISVEEAYASDVLTIPSSLAGNCAMSVPVGDVGGIPVGMQIMCNKFQEEKLFGIGKEVEKINL